MPKKKFSLTKNDLSKIILVKLLKIGEHEMKVQYNIE